MWGLLACACPTFEETEVVDASSGLPPGVLGEARDAAADFARWTAREGVCVPEVRLVDEVDLFLVGEAGGRYNTVLRDIELRRDFFPLREGLTHELCHALDAEESLSDDNPEVFPFETVEEDAYYPSEAARRHEAFARACEDGGYDRSLTMAVEARCGEVLDAQDRFLADVVYPGAQFDGVSEEAVALDVRTLAVPVDPERMRVVAATGRGGEIVLLVEAWGRYWRDRYALLFVDPDTGAIRRRVDVPIASEGWDGHFFATEGDPYLVLSRRDWAPRAWWLVGDALVPAPAPAMGDYLLGGVVLDGVAYAATTWREYVSEHVDLLLGELRATRLADGVEIALPATFPRDVWDRSVWADAIVLGPDGIELLAYEGLARLEGDTWALAPAPEELHRLAFVDERRVGLAWAAEAFVPVVERDGEWLLPDNPCDADRVEGDVPVELDGRLFIVARTPEAGALWLGEVTLP